MQRNEPERATIIFGFSRWDLEDDEDVEDRASAAKTFVYSVNTSVGPTPDYIYHHHIQCIIQVIYKDWQCWHKDGSSGGEVDRRSSANASPF